MKSNAVPMTYVRQAVEIVSESINEAARKDPGSANELTAGELREFLYKVARERANGGPHNVEPTLREVDVERCVGGDVIDHSTAAYMKALGRLHGRVASMAQRDGDAESVSWDECSKLGERSRWLVLLADELRLRAEG